MPETIRTVVLNGYALAIVETNVLFGAVTWFAVKQNRAAALDGKRRLRPVAIRRLLRSKNG